LQNKSYFQKTKTPICWGLKQDYFKLNFAKAFNFGKVVLGYDNS